MYNKQVDKIRKFFKRFGTDIAGYTCLALVLPVGALPGPGGIPLLVAGLGLLSIHNKWAKSLLVYVDKHSTSLQEIVFPNRRKINAVWDVFAVCLFVSAFAVAIYSEHWLIKILSTGMGAVSTTIFMLNRSRLDRIKKRITKR